MIHDRLCPVTFLAGYTSCPICDLLGAARTEERQIRKDIWQANIAPISQRNYEDGYRDAANGRPSRYR